MAGHCGFTCKYEEENREAIAFRASASTKLDEIMRMLQERKSSSENDTKQIWVAIDEVRNDIKGLYWKVGLISGGVSVITTILFSVLKG